MRQQFAATEKLLSTFVLWAALAAGCQSLAAEEKWVGTWACAPQLTEPRNLPPVPLANGTLREFVHSTIGGKRLRVRFSNAYGTNSVKISGAHVALPSGMGSAGEGSIDTNTDEALEFGGNPDVIIPAGHTVWSDPLNFNLPAVTNVAISIYFGNVSATTVTGHPGSRTTSFIVTSNAVSAQKLAGAKRTPHWYIITGIDVFADPSSKALVTLGDSITDGRGSTTDANDRWPDVLALRMSGNPATSNIGVLNMGIGGNGIFGGLGPSAQKRFDRDVLNQSGVRWVIIFEGVNDIGSGTTAAKLTNAYAQFIDKAHAANMLVYGATITPFSGSGYYTGAHEAERQNVNRWIRTSGKYDAVIDFDAAVRDPRMPAKLLSTYDSGDGLHLSPAGYRAMANAIDLKLLER